MILGFPGLSWETLKSFWKFLVIIGNPKSSYVVLDYPRNNSENSNILGIF